MKATNKKLELRKEVLKAAKAEQMGMNAAIKALNTTKGFADICKADELYKNIFTNAKTFVEYINILPIYQNGIICRAKAAKDEHGKVVSVEYIPRTSFTPYTIYTLAIAAKKARK